MVGFFWYIYFRINRYEKNVPRADRLFRDVSLTMDTYGKELVLDIHNCDSSTFTRKSIRNYFEKLCILIDMQRSRLCWWDDSGIPLEDQETEPHLKGTTAVQFITTSNIVIHTLDLLENVYVNIFSCKDFDADAAAIFSAAWFGGRIVNSHVVERK